MMIFISMLDGIKKNIYSFELLESFSNGTSWLDCFCDLQGISYTKILLLTALVLLLDSSFFWFNSVLCNSPSCTFFIPTGQERNTMGFETAASNGTKPWWWVLSFTSALEWTR